MRPQCLFLRTMKITLTNEDKTRKLASKARVKLLESAARDWNAAKYAASKACSCEILGHNKLRTCGLKLIEAAGHEQVSFEFFRAANGAIPKDMSFTAVKFCVHLARNYEQPFKTLQEVRATQRTFFEVFGHCESQKRLEAQSAHEANPWNEFVNASHSFTSLFDKLEVVDMDKWGKDKLATFIRETEPIVRHFERACDRIKLL